MTASVSTSSGDTILQSKLRMVVLLLCAGAGGVSGALAGGSPTGIGWWDTCLAAAVAMTVAAAGGWARPWAVLAALGLVAPFAASPTLQMLSVAALLTIVALQLVGHELAIQLGTNAAAVLAATIALRLATDLRPLDRFGAASMVAAAAFALVFGSGVGAAAPDTRRVICRRGGVGLALLSAVIVAPLAAVLWSARVDISTGSSASAAGLTAGRHGQAGVAIDRLQEAEGSLTSVADKLRSPWLTPSRLVPILSQHIHVGTTLAEEGSSLAAAAANAIEAADLESLRTTDGRVNLDVAQEAAVPARRLDVELRHSQQRLTDAASPWLLGPVEARRSGAVAKVDDASRSAKIAADGLAALPILMGRDSPRRYLVLLPTPAESRELGGFVANYLELVVDDGTMSIGESGRTPDLTWKQAAVLSNPSDYPLRYLANDPETYPQNWTGLPDFPLAARAIRDMYPTVGGSPLDGALYVDPIGLAALLRFIGPIDVPEIGRSLDHTSLAHYLLVEQYGAFDDKEERLDLLETISIRTFAKLVATDISNPTELGEVIGPVARGGHLLMTVFDPEANDFLESIELAGSFPEHDGQDFLSVVQANGAPNKLDTFLRRSVHYDVQLAESGELNASVSVTLENEATASLPPYVLGVDGTADGYPAGTNQVHLSIYTPHELLAVSVDGTEVPAERQRELGYNRYLVMVFVPMGESANVNYQLRGVVVDGPTTGHQVTLANQALVLPDDVTVRVVDRRSQQAEEKQLRLDEDVTLTFFQ